MSSSDAKPRIERRLVLLLATFCLVNPVVLFLLIGSTFVAAVVSIACIAAVQISASNPSRRILTAGLFNTLAVASILAHAEVILIHGFPDQVIENLYVIKDGYYFNKPLLNQQFRSPEFAVTYRTNGQGFRLGAGQEPSVWIDRVDWLVLGDSFTQGAQVEFEDLYSTNLNLRFPDKIVVNAGISGMGIAHEYNYFVDEGRKHAPDLIILQIGSFNDFMNVEASMASPVDRLMERSAVARRLLYDWKFGDPADLPLGRWTEPFYPDQQRNRDYNIFYKEASPSKRRDLESFREHLASLNDAVKQAGGSLLVTLLPTREQVSLDSYNEVVRHFNIDPTALDMRAPNQLMARLTEELDIEFLDLLPTFKSATGDLFFRLDEHLSPTGHAVVAEALGAFIEKKHGPSSAKLLSKELAGDRYPSLSHDGKLIAFQSIRNGSSELFVAAPDLSSARRLTVNGVDESHPMLSRDNSRVVFTEGSADHHRTKVVVMNLDGSRRRAITADPLQFGAIASFSRSNLKVVYAGWSSDTSGQFTNPQVIMVDLITDERRPLTPSNRESWRPVFAPDESSVAYISKFDGQFDLCIYEFATGNERRLTFTAFGEWDPQFAPDGRRIAYAARRWQLGFVRVRPEEWASDAADRNQGRRMGSELCGRRSVVVLRRQVRLSGSHLREEIGRS